MLPIIISSVSILTIDQSQVAEKQEKKRRLDKEADFNKQRETAKRSRLQPPALDTRWVMMT